MRALPLVVGLLWLLLPAPILVAAEVSGRNDPRFQAALELWLSDDDETALPEFAGLAVEGNRAAQILLAHIDAARPLQGPWLAALPRAERVALLRQPGGLSGRSWMPAAAADTPLAAAWVALWNASGRDEPRIARAFAEMGEDRAVRMTLIAMSLRERQGLADLAEEPFYPPSLRFLVWRDWARDPATEPRIAAEIAALLPGDPQIATITGEHPGAAERAAWLAEAAPAAPLRAFCAATCPDNVSRCLDAAFAFHAGPELADFGSPVESLVPSATWETSPRGRAMVLRRTLPLDPHQRSRTLAEIAALDACFGAALAAESERDSK
jgi:hypothetical protein